MNLYRIPLANGNVSYALQNLILISFPALSTFHLILVVQLSQVVPIKLNSFKVQSSNVVSSHSIFSFLAKALFKMLFPLPGRLSVSLLPE